MSADDAALISQGLSAVVLRPKEDKASQRYSLNWSASGSAYLDKASDTNVTGTFENAVKLTTKAGNRASVTASFFDPYVLDVQTATFEVMAGKPYSITTNAEGRTAIAGAGKITLDILVKDQFGNTVADGTTVEVLGNDIAVSGDAYTVDGKAQIDIKGNKEAGEKTYSIKVGDVVEERALTVDSIKLVIEVPEEVPRGGSVPVTIRAESDTTDLSGVQVQVTSLRGAIANGTFTLDGSNSIYTTLDAGNFVGDGTLVARVNDNLFSTKFKVEALSNDLEVSNPILVSSRIGSSSNSQLAETEIALKGDVGEQVEIDLRDYLSPNLLPAAFWDLHGASTDGRFLDNEYQREIVVHNALPQGQGVRREDRFIQITESDGFIAVPFDKSLARPDDVGVTVSFRPDEAAFGELILNYSASGLKVELTDDGRVKVTAQEENVATELLSQPISKEQWHRMGVHVVAQKLILQVNDQIFTTPLSGRLKGETGQYAVVLGKGYKGALNRLGLFDWRQTPILTLVGSGGKEQGSTTVSSDGKARFRISSNLSRLLALRENPNKDLFVTVSRILIAHALAEDEDACAMVPTTGVINAAEALLDFVVKCELQKKVRQAEVKVKTAKGFWQTTVAYAEFGLIKNLQTQISALGNSAIYLAKCLDGAVTGSTENAVATICDFVASMLLVGDIRDFAIHSYYYYTDNTEKFDYPTYVFAGLGIVGTFAELTGAGIAVDAALAGGKTASKVLKGTGVIDNLVVYLDKRVLNGVSDQKVEALMKALPMLQVVALVAFEGPALKEFFTSAIKTVEDFEVWLLYTYWMTEEGGLIAQVSSLETGVQSFVGFIVEPANAAVASKVSELLAVLTKVEAAATKTATGKNAGAVFTKVIKELQDAKGTDLAKLAGKSDELVALMAIYSRAGEKALSAFRKTPCGPSLCFNGRSMQEFIKDIGDIEKHLVSTNSSATDITKVFEQLSGSLTRKDGVEVDRVFVARGGAGTLQVLKRMIGDAKELEVLEFEKAVKTVGGTRHYDVRVRSGDDEFFIESKYWAQNKAKTHIVNAINIFKKENDEDGPPGQLLKDVLGYMTDKGAGKSVRWEFVEGSTGVDRKALMQTAMETIASNDGGNIQAFIAKQVGKNYSEVEDDVRKALEVILGGVKGVD